MEELLEKIEKAIKFTEETNSKPTDLIGVRLTPGELEDLRGAVALIVEYGQLGTLDGEENENE